MSCPELNNRVILDFLSKRLSQRADRGEDMSGLDLRGASLVGADFRGASLTGTNFSFADLRGARFENADIRFCHFWNCDLSYTRFDFADLTGADLDFATLDGAVFFNARIKQTDLPLHCVTLDQIRRSVVHGEAIPRNGQSQKKRKYAMDR